MIELRSPQTISGLSTSSEIPIQISRPIRFRHPGYSEPNLLFTLFGFDSPQGSLHHETARLTCALVANNRWDGYLSETPSGPPITVPPNGLLDKYEYYFIVPVLQQTSNVPSLRPAASSSFPITANSPTADLPSQLASSSHVLAPPNGDPYPIVPSFQHWRFPHDNLPSTWQRLPAAATGSVRSTTEAVRARDGSCRMTEFVEECEVAHLCPKSEQQWFLQNQMNQYGSITSTINHPTNLLLLRADVHRAFDKKQFVFIPKVDDTLCTHVLGDRQQHRMMYHNTTLHPVTLGVEYLFCRFAWAIFPLIGSFLSRGQPTLLALSNGGTSWADETQSAESGKTQSRRSSPTKSASPSKRARTQSQDQQDHDCGRDEPHESERGRKRKRSDERSGEVGTEGRVQLLSERLTCSTSPLIYRPQSTLNVAGADSADDSGDFHALQEQLLLEERARSDPDNTYLKEQQWANGILDAGGALDSSEYMRFFRAIGCDVVDEI